MLEILGGHTPHGRQRTHAFALDLVQFDVETATAYV